MAICRPIACSARTVRSAETESCSSAGSGISRRTRPAGTPWEVSDAASSSTISWCCSWRAEMLTASTTSTPTSCHAARSASARSITQRPMGMMLPFSSASGRKSAGMTMPLSGSFQRSSASAARTLPVASSTSGWYCRKNSLFSSPRRTRFSSSARSTVMRFRSDE